MTKTLSILILVYLFIGLCTLQAQQNRYVIFFTDKANTPFTITSPEEFLSARALERRMDQQITITEADLPVDPAYVDGLKNTGVNVFFTSKWFNAALIQAEPAFLNAIAGLNYVDSIAYVAPGARLSQMGRKMKLKEKHQYQEVTDNQLTMLGVDDLQQDGFLGQGLLIAFFDGGFAGTDAAEAFQHIYTSNRLLYTLDVVENDLNVYHHGNHGTKVFSITAGYLPDVYEGSAYGADYMLFVTEDGTSEYRIEEYNWLIAAEKADSAGVDIINSSLGYFDFDDPAMNYVYADMDGKTTVITQAATLAATRGILIVTSAGNEGSKAWNYITAPADADNIIAVGSVNSSGQISSFSSVGPAADGRAKPEVVAMGSGTSFIDDKGSIGTGSGTSFSTPLITGMAAGLWEAYPHLTNTELIALILQSGDRAHDPDHQYGYGVPDYEIFKSRMTDSTFLVFPNPVATEELRIAQYSGIESTVDAFLYAATGALIQQYQLHYSSMMDTQSISIKELQSGIYILWLKTNGVSQKFRIVKY